MIPKILHYCFGFAPDFGGKPWSLVHYVCVRSAIERMRPKAAYLYYQYEPSGPWWELTRKLLTPVKIEAPTQIFGRPLMHVAHQADVVRLEKLMEHGGIYLDADVFIHHGFDDLLNASTFMGREGPNEEFGLCNAVIGAAPGAPFISRWYKLYRWFRGQGRHVFWNEHSVKLPSKLAKRYPEEITPLPHDAFFWPLWTKEHIDWIFKATVPIDISRSYASHLWESNAWHYLEGLTPGRVRGSVSNFGAWCEPFLRELPDDFGVDSRDARCKVFRETYREGRWGRDGHSAFFSGVGSRGEAADIYVRNMAVVLNTHAEAIGRPLTVVDIGCGDFEIGRKLVEAVPSLNYIGCDIVPELIEHNSRHYSNPRVSFRVLDAVADELPTGDICLIRQVLQHLPNTDIQAVLRRLPYSYVYVTEGHPAERTGSPNPDKPAGADVRFDWRTGRGRGVELNEAPFNCKTVEIFRVPAPPREIIITEYVEHPQQAGAATFSRVPAPNQELGAR